MADITMCTGDLCDKKHKCYRHTATPNDFRQSYFVETPWVDHHGKQVCDKFWNNGEDNTTLSDQAHENGPS